MIVPPLSVGKALQLDPKEQSVAHAVTQQSGLIQGADGTNPAINYLVKKQKEANKSNKARPNRNRSKK